MPEIVNLKLLSHPWNWIIIALIAGFWLLLLVTIFPQPQGEE